MKPNWKDVPKPNMWDKTFEDKSPTLHKPNWKDAPKEANYLAQNFNGNWNWFHSKPKYLTGSWHLEGTLNINFWKAHIERSHHIYNNWNKTLERKPNKPSWDDAPEWAEWLAMDEDGQWNWFEAKPTNNDLQKTGLYIWDTPDKNKWEKATEPTKSDEEWINTLEYKPDTPTFDDILNIIKETS